MPTDIEIAQSAQLRLITDVASEVGLMPGDLRPYGHHVAKVRSEALEGRPRDGKVVLVTGMSPTPAGEGKSTVAVGLAQALRRLEKKTMLCLREPSLGPVFGIKGGAAGGGFSRVLPMDQINLHFTGDFHAITSAHSLLSACLDNNLQRGNSLGVDPRRINWKRTVDMNDRALRSCVIGLGGPTGGVPREESWTITAASEIMAIFCLALDLPDFERRVSQIVLGTRPDGSMVRAGELNVSGALALLVKDALAPNLVQTIEGGPALVHGGPFANIAHGCNSLIATRAGMALGDIVVTAAGFGSDLGAEKFFDIKCRMGDLRPEAAVIVATIRAMKHHEATAGSGNSGPAGLGAGLENLRAHIDNVGQFGVPPVVAVNQFSSDTDEEIGAVVAVCEEMGVRVAACDIWARGGEGGIGLAETVLEALDSGEANFRPLYELETTIEEKLDTIVRNVYGGSGVAFTPQAKNMAERLVENGMGELPVCIAKTQYSLSDDPKRTGRPSGFEITVRELRVSAGAGFIVALTGDVMVMPGLPAKPAAEMMKVHADGTIEGLF
ncbi:MAG: formate--tetrahydrofolate ligase [Gemmatimonadales bacterium]|nr:MAG: formate--tetrahydrofolate ligase [Gemmatimonadales bacterium]